jgi:hypothetical protein
VRNEGSSGRLPPIKAGKAGKAGTVGTARSETSQAEGRRGGVASLHDAVKDFLRVSGLTSRSGHGPVYEAFADAAGERFTRRARPVRFTRGELVVEVDSAAHLSELQGFLGRDIQARANQILRSAATTGVPGGTGREEIRRLTFRLKR